MDKLYKLLSELELVVPNTDDANEATASINLNPAVTWLKFILTDDKLNANERRVPKEEFSNLVKTGIFMPIKMENGNLHGNHAGSKPIGVITHLKEVGDKIIGLAALWLLERPDDVDAIKKAYADKNPIQLSWEILYDEEKDIADSKGKDLIGTALKGVAIVGVPAYEGRTPVIEVASMKEETLETAELEKKVADLETNLASLTTENSDLKAQVEELDSLRKFKADIEKAEADNKKFDSIKKKFSDAGLVKDEDYFSTNKEMLLGLAESVLDFMLQEMVAFSSTTNTATSSINKPEVPNLVNKDILPERLTPVDMAKKLKEMKSGNK
jgi:hypothetical protein